jgi:DNA-binding transcriptional regulator YhcF (GntR family)
MAATKYSKTIAKKLDRGEALAMRAKGMSVRQIAKQTDVHPSTVHRALINVAQLVLPPDQLEQYRQRQVDVVDSMTARTLASICDEDFQKASLLQKVTSSAILIEKSRLIKGQTTENIGVMGYFSAVTGSGKDDDYLLDQQVIDVTPLDTPAITDEPVDK